MAHIPHPRDLQEHKPQPRSAPHEFHHEILSLPQRPNFYHNGAITTDKNEGWCLWRPPQQALSFSACCWLNLSQGLLVHPGILSNNNKHTTINMDWFGVGRWQWHGGGIGRWHWEVALGVGVGRRRWAVVEDAAVVLGSAGGRRICNDGVGISVVKA